MPNPAMDPALARVYSAKRKLLRLLEQLGRNFDEVERKRFVEAVAPVEAQVQGVIELLGTIVFLERRRPARRAAPRGSSRSSAAPGTTPA